LYAHGPCTTGPTPFTTWSSQQLFSRSTSLLSREALMAKTLFRSWDESSRTARCISTHCRYHISPLPFFFPSSRPSQTRAEVVNAFFKSSAISVAWAVWECSFSRALTLVSNGDFSALYAPRLAIAVVSFFTTL